MQIHTTTSSNNYKILHIQKESPISLILFLVKNGSRFETPETSGISHFLEHMMFKPTTKRKTSKEINTELESIGGVANAFTGHECTGYYIQVLKENFDHAFEILSDLLQNGVLNPKDIKIEKGVVIEEIRMYEDSPSDKVGELAQLNAFPDQQLGLPVIGSEKTVSSFNRDQLSKFINTNYLQDDFLVVSVGDFDKEKTVKNTEKYLRPRSSGKLDFKKAKFTPKQKVNFHHKEDSNQTHSRISFEGISIFDENIYKYLVLEEVLGGGMGSILSDLLREKLGVAYYVGANHTDYLDTGIFEIYFGANFDKTKQTVDKIFEETEKLKKDIISDEELSRAKNFSYSLLAMQNENIGYLGQKYGLDYLMRGEVETLEEERQKIFGITKTDILETAREVFNDNYNITYIAKRELI